MSNWDEIVDRRVVKHPGRRETDCKVCADPGGFAVRVEHTEKKIEQNCEEIRKIKHNINNLKLQGEHIKFLKDELDEFKKDRKEFLEEMKGLKKFIKEGYVPISRYQWVERIAIILTGAGILAAINVFKA